MHPHLIPFGENSEEQYAILDVVAEAVPKGAVSFDLTHGFRHLGMVGFLSAFMLERISSLNVRGLWYGALDMTRDGITPVLKLDGLVRVIPNPLFNNLFCGSCSSPVPVHNRRDFSRRIT